MNKFLKALAYPFKKLDQGISKLVDAVLPESAQKSIISRKRLVYGAGILTAFASIFVAPLATPALITGALAFNLLATYCEENILKRRNQEAGEPAAMAGNQPTGAADNSNFKPNALSPDFKSAQENKASENAANNLAPENQASAIKPPANLAP